MTAMRTLLETRVVAAQRPWRGPLAQVLLTRTAPSLLLLGMLFSILGCFVLVKRPLSLVNVDLAFGILVAMALTNGAMGGDRRPSRWCVLFQMPVTPALFYFRALIIRWIVASTLVAIATIVFCATMPFVEASPRFILGLGLSTWIMTSLLLAVGFGASTLVRRREMSALLLLLVLSILQVALLHVLGLDGEPVVSSLVSYVLIPVDGLTEMMKELVSGDGVFSIGFLTHLVLYPAGWLLVAFLRLRHFAAADLPVDIDG
jgi:hypothetical protein